MKKTSVHGTKQKCRPALGMSVNQRRPEVVREPSNRRQ
jgi:hypothetical protein